MREIFVNTWLNRAVGTTMAVGFPEYIRSLMKKWSSLTFSVTLIQIQQTRGHWSSRINWEERVPL